MRSPSAAVAEGRRSRGPWWMRPSTRMTSKKKGSVAACDLLHREQEKVAAWVGQGLPAVPRFTFSWPEGQGSCPECDKPLRVLVTKRRRVVSLAYGEFTAVEKQGFCTTHPGLPSAIASNGGRR